MKIKIYLGDSNQAADYSDLAAIVAKGKAFSAKTQA